MAAVTNALWGADCFWLEPESEVPMIWRPRMTHAGQAWVLEVPLWMPWLACAALTACRFRADHVPPPCACPSCGYDRRGLAADAKCPECGAVPSK